MDQKYIILKPTKFQEDQLIKLKSSRDSEIYEYQDTIITVLTTQNLFSGLSDAKVISFDQRQPPTFGTVCAILIHLGMDPNRLVLQFNETELKGLERRRGSRVIFYAQGLGPQNTSEPVEESITLAPDGTFCPEKLIPYHSGKWIQFRYKNVDIAIYQTPKILRLTLLSLPNHLMRFGEISGVLKTLGLDPSRPVLRTRDPSWNTDRQIVETYEQEKQIS